MTLRRPAFPDCLPDEKRDKYMEALATHDWEARPAGGRPYLAEVNTQTNFSISIAVMAEDQNGSISPAWENATRVCRRCSTIVCETRPNWRGMFSCDDVFGMVVATQVLET